MAHGLLYGASYSNNTLTFVDKSGRTICSASLIKCLRLTATQNGSSVALQKEGSGTLDNHYKYAVNGGAWQDYTLTNPGVAIPLDAGDYVEWRCTERNTMQSKTKYVRFVMTGRIEASNPITSIVYDKMSYDDIDPVATTANTSYACYKLFLGCTALTKAPELPATNLRPNCYNTLFSGCTNLTVAPVLPATKVYGRSYSYMFQSTGITSAPSLPATNVQEMAYEGMFYNCPNLVTPPPELPATSIGLDAYQRMFLGCSALTKSPVIGVLSARSGASTSGDLGSMFYGCLALNEIKCALNTVPAGDTNYAKSWTFNVAPTGDFYGDPTFPWASGVDGIPVGWEVWVLGAEDTGNTTSMYYRGTQTTVMVGTSDYGTCYSIQGWVGFKSLSGMHDKGYTIDAQTSVTIYKDDYPMTAYTCAAGGSDGFTELMYDACDGKGYRTSAQLLEDGYALHQEALTLKATADNSSVKLIINGTTTNAYDVDTGNGWEAYTFDTVINLNNGDTCKWRCQSSSPYIQSSSNYVQFVMTGTIEASGSINSMLTPSFDGITSIQSIDYAFYKLFYGCTALTKAPALPATALSDYCYYYLLFGCTALTKAPALPALTLTSNCYRGMLSSCTSLVNPPEIAATNVASGATNCCRQMFSSCSNLVKSPDLKATTLASGMYYQLFNACSSLAEIHTAASDISASSCLYNWLTSTSSTGDIFCNPNTVYPSTTSGIPEGWEKWVYGATETGTTTMYHNGTAETVKVGTSDYGVCYSAQGWVGFKTLAEMHTLGYTLGAQTTIAMYFYDEQITAYSCAANAGDGFTEAMYDTGSGRGYLDISSQNDDGYYLVSTPWTGLELTATADNSSVSISKGGSSAAGLASTFEYSTGRKWNPYTYLDVINLNNGESCKFRCTYYHPTTNYQRYPYFVMTGTIEASGNCYSMLSKAFENITSMAGYYLGFLFKNCASLTTAPTLPATTLSDSCYSTMFMGAGIIKAPTLPATNLVQTPYKMMFQDASSLNEVHALYPTLNSTYSGNWLSNVAATGSLFCDPTATVANGASGLPSGWERFVYGATDTGSTATMYYNGVSETVRVGTSDWGACYSASGWAGFKTLEQMHSAGHTFGAQTAVTLYSMDGTTIATYSCIASNDDGFTETMYFAGGTWKDLATANSEGYYLNEWEVPLTLRATADNSSVTLTKTGTLSNTFEVNTGSGWSSYTFGTAVALNNGEHVNFRCSDHPTTQSGTKYVKFVMTGMIEAHGNIQSMLSQSLADGGYVERYAFCSLFSGCSSLVKAPLMPATQYDAGSTLLPNYGYRSIFNGTSIDEATTRFHDGTLVNMIFPYWLDNVPASGCVFAYPDLPLPEDSTSGVPEGWHRFILDAEDTGTTTSMYYHGAQVTVKLGTYSGTACYSVSGWKGFKDLDGMHKSGYSFDPQTPVTMYYNGSAVTAYSCAPGGTDGFTSTVYNSNAIGRDTGFKTISNMHPYNITLGVQTQITMYYYNERTVTAYECAANNDDGYTDDMYCLDASGATFKSLSDQSVDGYYLTPTPWTGLKITSGTWTGDYTIRTSLYKVGTLNNTFQIDDGSGWRDYSLGTIVDLQKNSSLKFRRRSGTTQQSEDNYLRFGFTPSTSTFTESSGKITVSGNPYSLLTKTGFDSITSLANYPYALYKLFWQQNAIGSASGLVLPAMTLSTHCYHDLLSTCEYLLDAPELPATTLATYCYEGLYYGCSRLRASYHLLLPATTLVEGCYMLLFYTASLINEVRIAATNTTIPTNALLNWLASVSASGTVYAPTSLNLPRNSSDGVPSGWTRLPLSDYPTT